LFTTLKRNSLFQFFFPDIRTLEHVPGKSINLAMSVRALSALDRIGLGKHVSQEYGIPMRARMIHNLDKTTYPGD
jgi:kynurenine 3-monooxygenase